MVVSFAIAFEGDFMNYCSCKGSDGKLKGCYLSAEDAIRVARDCYSKRGIVLSEYQCPTTSKYWHLSKNQRRFL